MVVILCPLRGLATSRSASPAAGRRTPPDVGAMDQDHQVGVLRHRARPAPIGQHLTHVGELLAAAVELGDRDQRQWVAAVAAAGEPHPSRPVHDRHVTSRRVCRWPRLQDRFDLSAGDPIRARRAGRRRLSARCAGRCRSSHHVESTATASVPGGLPSDLTFRARWWHDTEDRDAPSGSPAARVGSSADQGPGCGYLVRIPLPRRQSDPADSTVATIEEIMGRPV